MGYGEKIDKELFLDKKHSENYKCGEKCFQ